MSKKHWVYRVQDSDGRGPFKPGFSEKWLDDNVSGLPPIFQEFDMKVLKNSKYRNFGCACRSLKKLKKWFSETELNKLKSFGYYIVKIRADQILAESENQVLFSKRKPLNKNVVVIEG